MEIDYCNKCGICCNNIRANIKEHILYWDEEVLLPESFAQNLILKEGCEDLYYCKFLKNNICTNPDKPELCKNYPSSPFVELYSECGYSGYIFMKNEKIKQKVRKLKEEILHYQAIIETTSDKKEHNQLMKIINSHQHFIDKYKKYGSKNW